MLGKVVAAAAAGAACGCIAGDCSNAAIATCGPHVDCLTSPSSCLVVGVLSASHGNSGPGGLWQRGRWDQDWYTGSGRGQIRCRDFGPSWCSAPPSWYRRRPTQFRRLGVSLGSAFRLCWVHCLRLLLAMVASVECLSAYTRARSSELSVVRAKPRLHSYVHSGAL